MAIKRLNIQTTQRNVIARGPFSTHVWNSTIDEVTTDLANLAFQWNTLVVPMASTIPDGTQDSAVNAYVNGLDGKTFYVDALADTTPLLIRYYNQIRFRPKTLKEALDDIYALINGVGNIISTTIVAGGGLTDAQKAAIGIHIFDASQTSSPSSLEGLANAATLNLIQLAKDVYGPTWALNNNGNPILTNSVEAMVNALLLIHNGHWSDDITVNHDMVSGGGGTLAASYNAGSSGPDQTITLKDLKGGRVLIEGTIVDGTWTGDDTLLIDAGYITVPGSETTGVFSFRNKSPVAVGFTDSAHLSATVTSVATNTVKEAIQIQASAFSAGPAVEGLGVGIGYGLPTNLGVVGGYKSAARTSAVVIDPEDTTFTTGFAITTRSDDAPLLDWDNGAITFVTGAGASFDATPVIILSIPINNTPIRVVQGRVLVNATNATGLAFATWAFQFTLGTALLSGNLSSIQIQNFNLPGVSDAWVAQLQYFSNSICVFVTGAAATAINWRAAVEMFGVRA